MNIGIFIGSGAHPELEAHIESIGQLIASRKHSIGFCSAKSGLAEALYRGVTSIQGNIEEYDTPGDLIDYSDCFIAMPGGLDMLDSLILYLQHMEIGASDKPLAIYDIGMMMDHIRSHLLLMEKMGFIKAHYLYSRSINDILDRFEELVYEDVDVDSDITCPEGEGLE